jgi:hypothetical protein
LARSLLSVCVVPQILSRSSGAALALKGNCGLAEKAFQVAG